MATTDAKAGFRLPWSTDRQTSEPAAGQPAAGEPAASEPAAASEPDTSSPVAAAAAWPTEDAAVPEKTVAAVTDAPDAPMAADEPAASPAPSPTPAPVAPPPVKKPSKFMADLTKAMQAAAEDARSRALAQLQADAKTHVETIHGRASSEAATLRRMADDDVAAVREWSKAEIARIREETEARITDRKARLETEIEQHAGVIEAEIDAVQKTVAAFEAEMADFFERLLGEEDPSRFATMAENLPEAPAFEAIVPTPVEDVTDDEAPMVNAWAEPTMATAVAEAPVAEATIVEPEAVASVIDEPVSDTVDTGIEAVGSDVVEAGDAEPATAEAESSVETPAEAFDREAAFAAIQAAAEAAEAGETSPSTDAAAGDDPRLAALGITPDFDAAEAEAFAAAGESDEEIPEIADEAVASRIAGLVPGVTSEPVDESVATQVVVVGLISVASIASFKRHLSRLPGVQSVGVSSGPDGEFIFAVKHGAEVVLRDVVPSLPTFQARVTGATDGVVQVTAHDPESDA